MKILHISTDYKPIGEEIGHGGVERLVFWLAEEQLKQGHTVQVVTVEGSHVPYAIELFPRDIQVTKARDRVAYERLHRATDAVIDHLLRTEKWDIVHDHMGAYLTSQNRADIPPRIGTILSCYGLLDNPHYVGIYNSIPSLRERLPHVVVTVCSMNHQTHLSPVFHADHIVYHAVPPQPLARSARPHFILYWAAIQPGKAQLLALAAAEQANTPIVFAGPVLTGTPAFDAYAAEFRQRVCWMPELSSLATPEAVLNAIGQVHRDTLGVYIGEISSVPLQRALFANATRFLLCASHAEPFSLALLEAMAHGLPIVAGPFESALEEIGKAGVYIEALSVDAIVQAIECKPADSEFIQAYARKMFSLDNWVTKWSLVYDDALSKCNSTYS